MRSMIGLLGAEAVVLVPATAQPCTLDGFPALQTAGTLTKDGELRFIARRVVAIDSAGGDYILFLDVVGPPDRQESMLDHLDLMDQSAKIRP